MTELQFVDELPGEKRPYGRASVTAARVAELKANPGRWAPWPAKITVGAVKKVLQRFEGDVFEADLRLVGGKSVVFVRFVPPAAAATPEPKNNGNGATTRPPPDPAGNVRPRVECRTCHQFINIETGEGSAKALTRHERTNPVCKEANRRRR